MHSGAGPVRATQRTATHCDATSGEGGAQRSGGDVTVTQRGGRSVPVATAAGRPPAAPGLEAKPSLCVLLEQRADAAASRSARLGSARLGPPLGGTAHSDQPASPDCCPSRRSLRTSSVQLCVSTAMPLVAVVSRAAVRWADHSISFSSAFGPLFVRLRRFGRPFLPRLRTFRPEQPARTTSSGSSNSGGSVAAVSAHRCGGSLCALPPAGRIDFSAAEGRGAAGRRRGAPSPCGGLRLREPVPPRGTPAVRGAGNGNGNGNSTGSSSGLGG